MKGLIGYIIFCREQEMETAARLLELISKHGHKDISTPSRLDTLTKTLAKKEAYDRLLEYYKEQS